MNEIIIELLKKRGVEGEENIKEFLSPKPQLTYDPFLLSDMEEGVDLILSAAENGKKICIYGDYDADGMTSIAILKTVLDMISDNVIYYVPSRFDDGYGLNTGAIDRLNEQGVDLIVTVDCGITSEKEVRYCHEIGIDIIVTDHHAVPSDMPDCPVINPKRSDCSYPCDFLAGCGIAFKMAQAVQRKAGLDSSVLNRVLDIVAIGTVGDIVPLVDENRTIVKYGIRQLKKYENPGISALADRVLKNSSEILSENISFGLVPHLNAAGRLETAETGVRLFLAEDSRTAGEIADHLVELNAKRKMIQEKTYREAVELYEEHYSDRLFPMIRMKDAHEGITGIVAGKLKEYCYRPVAVLTENEDGTFKGTSRGIEGIDLHKVLSKYENMFVKFGGHKGACGFTITEENLSVLQDKVEEDMRNTDPEIFVPKTSYDMRLSGSDLTLELARDIESLEPFGCGNEKPVFMLPACEISDVRALGRDANHMRFRAEPAGGSVQCMLFSADEEKKEMLISGEMLDLYGRLEINRWNGREYLQFIVSDLK